MTVRFRIEPEASAELGEAALWYELRRHGLGGEFLEAVDGALDIARFPRAGTPVPDVPPELPVRRVTVKRFPFHVVYLALADVIRLLASAHDSRLPGYWHSRIQK